MEDATAAPAPFARMEWFARARRKFVSGDQKASEDATGHLGQLATMAKFAQAPQFVDALDLFFVPSFFINFLF